MRPAAGGRTLYDRCALGVLALLLAGFGALYAVDEAAYLAVLDEDGPVEWATVALLVVVTGLALRRAAAARRAGDPTWRFLAGLAGLGALAVLEEISWGQRLFGIASPEFFLRHSDQGETNLHNVFQQWSGVATKLVAGVVLSAYGVTLPLLARHDPAVAAWAARRHVPVPPLALVPGFLVGTLLMIDFPTYEEEEIGELIYALNLTLLLLAGERAPATP